MPCILAVLALAFPRVVIVVLYLFTNFFRGVFETLLWPVMGFLFMPLTLLAYAWMERSGRPSQEIFLVVMVIAVVLDLGLIGGGRRARSRD
jgi:hypothetical protein